MNKLTILNENGQLVTDSREVSEMVGKQHKDLLESIRGYIKYLISGNFRPSDFFIESNYIDGANRNKPCYLLTKKGCDMVANKMTGEKGVLFTAEYVTRFEEMERDIKNPMKNLSKELKAIFTLDSKQQELENEIRELRDNMPLLTIDCEELQKIVKKVGVRALGGKGSKAYKNNSIRSQVYGDIQQQIKREFGVRSYKAIKRCQLNIAIEIVKKYEIRFILRDQIISLNNQMVM